MNNSNGDRPLPDPAKMVEAAMNQIANGRKQILNDFSKAYLAQKQVDLDDIELVERQVTTKSGAIQTSWRFRDITDNRVLRIIQDIQVLKPEQRAELIKLLTLTP